MKAVSIAKGLLIKQREYQGTAACIAERAIQRLLRQPIDLSLLAFPKSNKPALEMTDDEVRITAAHAIARLQGVGPYAKR